MNPSISAWHFSWHPCPWDRRAHLPWVSAGLEFYSKYTDYISSMLFPSFLALWLIDSFLSPLLDSLPFPSLGTGSRWGKGREADEDRGSFTLFEWPRSSHWPLLCVPIICFSHCQHGLLIFLCSLCLPVAHMGCSSFYTNPKLPGVRHNESPSKTNMGAHVDCWDANKITAIIGP